jgi:hypothetical protein
MSLIVFSRTRSLTVVAAAAIAAALIFGACVLAEPAAASTTEWSLFEDHDHLVRTTPSQRERTLQELRALGADTLRITVKWNEVAPRPSDRKRPAFDAADPAAYPGFGPYDDLLRKAAALGFRSVVTLTPDAPRWATQGGRGGNYRPSAKEFGQFAAAVGRRYSGTYAGLPKVSWWSLWNEPNHPKFLSPQAPARSLPAARVYRAFVNAGIRALRSNGQQGASILVGEFAPVGPRGAGPLRFLRAWLCLDNRYHRLRGRAARRQGCRNFEKVQANGFAIHAYTRPIPNYRPRGDAVTLRVIRRLARALDKAARAGRLPRKLPIYNTEFGIQTNPPDPYQGGSLARQAQILNESEEFSYRYPRLKSYSQYLLYDAPPVPGPRFQRYSSFQSGLRFVKGKLKPAYNAYKFPIVVHRRKGGARVWGRVRPGSGVRSVQLQRKVGRRFRKSGGPTRTNRLGYFTVRARLGTYRFQAFAGAAGGKPIGTSRTARPSR